MKNHADDDLHIGKDAVIKLMLKHAMWLAEEAKRYVDVKSWKEFAQTKVLDVDRDAEMDESDYERLVPCIPSSPAALASSPKPKRVSPRTRPQKCHLIRTPILTATERRFPVLPRVRFRRPALRKRIRICVQPGTFTISTHHLSLRRSACAYDVPPCT